MNTHKHLNIICVLLLLCRMLFLLTSCGEIPLQTYDEIIDEFRTMLTEEPARDSTAEQTADPIRAALAEVAARCEDPSVMAYSLHDINDDGTEELLLTEIGGTDIYAIFTMKGKDAVLLDVFKQGVIKQDGCIYYVKESETQTTYHKNYLVDGVLTGLTYGYEGSDPSAEGDSDYFKIENGIRTELTREEYLDILGSHQFLFMPMHSKQTGIFAIPMLEEKTAEEPPLLKIRTYDDVLALCRVILDDHCASYKRGEWTDGAYDTIYTFEDARTYTLFSRLLHAFGETKSQENPLTSKTLGYDMLDLNGDGTDELILMEDNYSLKAILTLRGDLPVLLLTSTEYIGYISADGYVHGTRNAPDNNAASAYQYCMWEIRDSHSPLIICLEEAYLPIEGIRNNIQVNYGKRTELSDDAYDTLRQQCDPLPDNYKSQEYTRAFSGLTFHPLLSASPVMLNTATPFVRDPYRSTFSHVFTQTDSHTWETEFDFFAPTADDENAYLTLTAVVTEENGTYRFDSNSVRGRIEPIQGGFWLIPEEIADSSIVNKPYLYFYNEQ